MTRIVDDDGRARVGDCDASRRGDRRVQPAVDDSGPGDIVLVCPGEYPGVLITQDDLTVRSVVPWGATLFPRVIFVAKGGQLLVVHVSGAERVRLEGFRIESAHAADETCRPIGLVVVDGGTGWIHGNRFVATSRQEAACTRYATAILAVQTPWVVISGNVMSGFELWGIGIAGELEEGGATTATITGNTIERLSPASTRFGGVVGIHIEGDPASARTDVFVRLRENLIYGAPDTPLATGIDSEDADVDARRNIIDGARTGVRLDAGSGTLARNSLVDGSAGIRLWDATVEVRSNRATGFEQHGIVVGGDVSANRLVENDFSGSGGVDCV